MAWKLTLAGTDRTTKIHRPGSVWVDWVLNERATARFVCKPGFVPARFSEAVIYAQNGTTVLYGGLVNPRRSMAHEATRALYRTSVDCADYGVYADWCYQTKTYASPVTLKTVLTDLVTDKLSAYSITLHASQVTGPTLEAFAWTTMRVSDALRQLSERTGYVWMITSEKKLRMVVPGTDAAPYTITDAAWNCIDLHWSDTVQSGPVPTDVIVLYGPDGIVEDVQWWDAEGANSWVTTNPHAVPMNRVVMGGVNYWVGAGGPYSWDQPSHTLTRGWAPVGTAGQTIRLYYSLAYPLTATATTGGTPKVEVVYRRKDLLQAGPATEAATQLLARGSTPKVEVAFTTKKHGFAPGQLLTVNLAPRNVTLTAVITTVSLEMRTDSLWGYRVGATQTAYLGSTLDQWRELLGGRGSGIGSGVPGAVIGGYDVVPSTAYLGGSRNTALTSTPAAYLPVVDFVPYVAKATGTALVRVDLWARAAGVGCTGRLYDVTAATAVGTTDKVTATTATEKTVAVALTSGHTYRLDILADTAGGAVFGIGALEVS